MIKQGDRWELYRDKSNQWQWRKFENNKVVAVSGDGFYSRQACAKDARQKGYEGGARPLSSDYTQVKRSVH
jgi:hypothetical protein